MTHSFVLVNKYKQALSQHTLQIRVHSVLLLLPVQTWICLHVGCKKLDNLLRYEASRSMNYEIFYEIAASWPSAEREREAGWSYAIKSWPVTPGVWLFPGDLVCWLIWLCFVLPLLGIAEQIVVMSLWGGVAALRVSIYPSSITVLQGVSWWIDQTAQTSNNK